MRAIKSTQNTSFVLCHLPCYTVITLCLLYCPDRLGFHFRFSHENDHPQNG
jgi:hypothetical protein